MSAADYVNIGGMFLGAWVGGFAAGMGFKMFRQTWEKVTGFSSGG